MKKTLLVGMIAVFFLLTLPLWNGTNRVLAMNNSIPIQGKLTDAGGNPLNGNYEMKATIYDHESAGTALCTDTDTIVVTKGLFVMNFANCSSNVFGGVTQLYLGIQVGSDLEMTPRQPLYGAPFAHGLVNGVLSSAATTYQFIPGSAVTKNHSDDTTRWDLSYGSAKIYRGATIGNKSVRFPVTIPSVLYGQSVRVTAITVYYKCQDGALNYITSTFLYKNTDADSAVALITDGTDRTSNTAANYTINTDPLYNTLSSSQGILTLLFSLYFADDANYIQISGIRLTLDTNF
jgi:hypothetical protein